MIRKWILKILLIMKMTVTMKETNITIYIYIRPVSNMSNLVSGQLIVIFYKNNILSLSKNNPTTFGKTSFKQIDLFTRITMCQVIVHV